MLTFQINLIRHRPVPLPQRRPMALALLLYLLVSGAFLSWAFYQGTRDVLAARQQSHLQEIQRQTFLSRYAGWHSVDAYANNLRQQMKQADLTLAAAEQLLRQRLPAAHILRDLASPLPDDVRLLNIDINAAGGALRFDLAVPVDLPGTATNTTTILTAWRNAPLLKRVASGLREQSSKQASNNGRSVFLLHFEAALQEGL